jgi:hypothetical protein
MNNRVPFINRNFVPIGLPTIFVGFPVLVTTTTYIGNDALIDVVYNNTAGTKGQIDSIITDSWDNGLPSDTNVGLFDGTAGGGNTMLAAPFDIWFGVAVRQTGGTLSDTSLAMRGGVEDGAGGVSSLHSTLEIDDTTNTDFATTNLTISGQFTMWNQLVGAGATGNTLNMLNGYVDVGVLNCTSPADATINILNGRLDADHFANARVTVNMLTRGTGEFNLADMYGTDADPAHQSKLTVNMILNFESGSGASMTISSNNGGSASSAWTDLVSANRLRIDGVSVADLSKFSITSTGGNDTTITLGSPSPLGEGFPYTLPITF